MAPYCAIPRDYLSDTPLLRAMGFLVSQHSQLGAIPPPPFLSISPLGEHAKWGCDTPPPKGYLSDTLILARYPTLHSENIARARKLLRNYFPRDCAKLSQSIAWNDSCGIVFGAIARFCRYSLLSYCSCSMLPNIDLRNGHFAIAPKYFWRIISGWIAQNSRNHCAK